MCALWKRHKKLYKFSCRSFPTNLQTHVERGWTNLKVRIKQRETEFDRFINTCYVPPNTTLYSDWRTVSHVIIKSSLLPQSPIPNISLCHPGATWILGSWQERGGPVAYSGFTFLIMANRHTYDERALVKKADLLPWSCLKSHCQKTFSKGKMAMCICAWISLLHFFLTRRN